MTAFEELIQSTLNKYSKLQVCETGIKQAYEQLHSCFSNGHKLLVCGNGGSASDAEHIVTELVNRFAFKRELDTKTIDRLIKAGLSEDLAGVLQPGLKALSLGSNTALNTAIANDLGYPLVYAQQVLAYGEPGDILLAISTSGNSHNVLNAIKVAKAKDMGTIGLTGSGDGELDKLVNLVIKVDSSLTSEIQELHLPVYHLLCKMLELSFFKKSD